MTFNCSTATRLHAVQTLHGALKAGRGTDGATWRNGASGHHDAGSRKISDVGQQIDQITAQLRQACRRQNGTQFASTRVRVNSSPAGTCDAAGMSMTA
jgi:hypothetical protein